MRWQSRRQGEGAGSCRRIQPTDRIVDEFTVKVYGDTAVVWFTQRLIGPSQGRALAVAYRYHRCLRHTRRPVAMRGQSKHEGYRCGLTRGLPRVGRGDAGPQPPAPHGREIVLRLGTLTPARRLSANSRRRPSGAIGPPVVIHAFGCTWSEVDAEDSLRAISGSQRRHAPTAAAAARHPRSLQH